MIPVYTLPMIAFEKLRAIYKQMLEYGLIGSTSPRSRDFFDIHVIATRANVQLGGVESADLLRNIFEAKRVPLNLLSRIQEYRDFHRTDWPSVLDAIGGTAESYDLIRLAES